VEVRVPVLDVVVPALAVELGDAMVERLTAWALTAAVGGAAEELVANNEPKLAVTRLARGAVSVADCLAMALSSAVRRLDVSATASDGVAT
jgi:hypothetical protein